MSFADTSDSDNQEPAYLLSIHVYLKIAAAGIFQGEDRNREAECPLNRCSVDPRSLDAGSQRRLYRLP